MIGIARCLMLAVALVAGTPCAAATWVANDLPLSVILLSEPLSPALAPDPDRMIDERSLLAGAALLIAFRLRRRSEPGIGRALPYRADQIRSPA